MEACSKAEFISLSCPSDLGIHPKDLCCLVFRVLTKLLGHPFSLLKKFWKGEHVYLPLMETMVGTLPELPQDMLMDIFATLEIPDLVRAGSVCSSWHSAYTSLRNLGKYKHSQTPCLLYTSESAGESVACLYSLVEKRTYKLTLPEPPIRSRFLIGSSYGWLVTVDEISQMHLVNPITREQIALPSVNTIKYVEPIFNDSGAVHMYELSWLWGTEVTRTPSILALTELRDHLFHKAFVFPDSSTGSYIVVLIHNPYCHLSFARAGDDKWTWLPHNACYLDCVYMDDLLYALTSQGQIDAFDLTATTVTRKVVMNQVKEYAHESMYIIRAPWGDLMQIWRTLDFYVVAPESEDEGADALCDEDEHRATTVFRTKNIMLYKVDMAAKELVETTSLTDLVLFLGHNLSLCLSSEEYPQLKANHVYFTDDREEWIMKKKNYPRDVGVFDLENSSRKEIVSPQIWSNWPCPMWITLSLMTMNQALSK